MGLTPMMLQYLQIHDQVKDSILFFRLGDFYEMFFDDAVLAAKELELTLTGRDCGLEEKAPMCGVPFHSADAYIAKLVEKGHKVAICEQLEDPATATGLVKRDIIRVVTPGTVADGNYLNPEANNFLVSIFGDRRRVGLAFLDISTGEFFATEYKGSDTKEFLLSQFSRYNPSEALVHSRFCENTEMMEALKNGFDFYLQPFPAKNYEYRHSSQRLCDQFGVYSVEALGFEGREYASRAAGALLHYLDETQKQRIEHINSIAFDEPNEAMALDSASIRNLELTRTLRTGSKQGSLLGILDKTVTAAGSRLLKSLIEAPLLDCGEINARLDRTEELFRDEELCEKIGKELQSVYDLERICTKINYANVVPADLISLKQSIQSFGNLTDIICASELKELKSDFSGTDRLEDIYETLEASIAESRETKRFGKSVKIKTGYNRQLDEYRRAREEGSNWLSQLEEEERKKTGIANLKVKFNKVFGYFIEVTNSKKEMVPQRYIRKQTLANSERYFTEELKALEEKVVEAEEGIDRLEAQLYSKVIDGLKDQIARIQAAAKLCSRLDVFRSFAQSARDYGYVRPEITQNGEIHILKGRHPVVEQFTGRGYFISNDTDLTDSERMMLITGPNMAGKSTYIRQNALIVLMAQIGSFVPAEKASISVVDRIFTRVGASDDLSTGQSTFMVEMTEVSNILKNATKDSLVILDEIGRGTSTFDGISIAWAISEDLLKRHVKTLFATHYHELTELEEAGNGLANYSIEVHEAKDGVVFLRKIRRGRADQSYGVEVAKLAGFPKRVINRANQILNQLESKDHSPSGAFSKAKERNAQLSIFSYRPEPKPNPVLAMLEELDPDELTPREALKVLYNLVDVYNENKNA